MNERYLFRGKRINGEGWLTGRIYDLESSIFIFPPKSSDSPDRYEVDPATIGQCTGLRDSRHTLIFEGDIVKVRKWTFNQYETHSIEWGGGGYKFRAIDSKTGIAALTPASAKTSVIIGNIHDNPELLKEERA